MRDRRLRGSAFHGVVSTGASTPESFGFSNPETTPLSIPTNPATAPRAALTSRLTIAVLVSKPAAADERWLPALRTFDPQKTGGTRWFPPMVQGINIPGQCE